MARTEVTGKQIKDQSVDLAVDVTGVLPVANGGTGSSSLTLNNVLLGNGTGALQSVSPGTAGNVLTSNGSTWVSAVPAAAQVTLNGSETLSNKTLTSPKIDYILDPNGAPAMWVGSQANAVNYAWIRNGAGETTGPQFRAAGPGTTIDVGVFSKGAGMISLGDGGSYAVAQFRPAASSPANYFVFQNTSAGGVPSLSVTGSDANVSINLISKGSGSVQANGIPVVTTTGSQTLSNKTLTNPKIQNINDLAGTVALQTATTGGTNFLQITNSVGNPGFTVVSNNADQSLFLSPKGSGTVRVFASSGNTPTLTGAGADANHNLNLQSQGSGVVQANGVPVVTTTGSQTLTNKTINSATINSPTLVNLTFSGTTTNSLTIGPASTNAHVYLAGPPGLPTYFAYAQTAGSYSYLSTAQSGVLASLSGDLIVSSRAAGKSIIFGTATSGSTDVERMRIANDGEVTVGGKPVTTAHRDFTNLAAGSDFADGTWGLWKDISRFTISNEQAHSGTYSIKLAAGSGGASAFLGTYPTVHEFKPGDQVYMEYWAYADDSYVSDLDGKLRIGAQDNSLLWYLFAMTNHFTQRNVWQKFSTTYTVPAGVSGLIFTLQWNTTSGNLWIDDIIIRRIPAVESLPSSVVTTTGSQTLTNKTLTTPVINGLPTGTGVSSAATGNTLAARNNVGDTSFRYLHAEWVSNSHAVVTRNSDTAFYSTNDNYIRKNTATGFKTSLALNNVDNTSDATKNSAVATLTNKTLTSPTISTPTINGTTTISGDVTVDNGTSSLVVIRSDDTGTSGLLLRGQSQGTSYVEVTQDGSYGGGMSFFGGGGSTFATGESTDSVTFYRKGAGTRTAVFGYGWNSNNVNFAGNIAVAGNITSGGIAVPTISSSSTLTNKTISGSSNTLTNISISSLSNAPSLFNNMGEVHQQRTSFDAQGAASTVDFGWRYVQGSINGPGTNSATQYYSQFIGLGSNYAYNTYGMQIAYPRNVTSPYISIRYQEGSVFGSWRKISAGYADSAGDADTLDGQHASAFVTPSGTATLTNKTITSPTFTGTAIGPINVMSNLINLDDWNSSPISIRERQGVANTNLDDKYSPNLNFHWASRVSNSLWMNTNGQLNWGGYSAAGVPAADGTINAGTFVGNLNGNATTASSASSITGGIPNNSNYEIRARVIRNSNSTTWNDGLYIGYGNTNGGLTRLYGGGDTTNPVTVSTGGQLTVSGNIFSGGVAVPTISSTHTLTNKTLTSPTISDPVINGNATGTAISTANTANTLVKRDGNGDFSIRYVFSSYLNMSHGVSGTTNDTIFYSSKDNYIRKNNASGFKSSLGLNNVDNTSDATKNSATATLTNKRITPRIGSVTSTATPSINTDIYDQYNITALATNITSVTITGTPTDGQKLMLRIKDNGTARAITWGASFVSSGTATLLTTTVVNKTHLVGLLYDSAAAKWVCIAADSLGY